MKRLFLAGAAMLAIANSAQATPPPTTPYAIKDAVGATKTECTYSDASSLFYVCHLNFGWNPAANSGAGGAQAWTMDANGAGLVLVEGTVAVGNAQEHTDLQALLSAMGAPPLATGAATAAGQAAQSVELGQLHTDLTSGLTVTGPLTNGQLTAAALANSANQVAAQNQAHADAGTIATAAAGGLTNTQLTAAALATASGQAAQATALVQLHTDLTPSGGVPIKGLSSANFLPSQITIGTTSTLIVAARAGRVNVTIYNASSATEYIGPSGVTPSTGFPIPAGQALSVATTAALYGVAASSASAAEYETF